MTDRYEVIDAGHGTWIVVDKLTNKLTASFASLPAAVSFRDAANTGRVALI